MALSPAVAFQRTLSEVPASWERLRGLGVTPLSYFTEETDEPSVIGWIPAASAIPRAAAVYLRDPDGAGLPPRPGRPPPGYLAMLDDPPRPEAGMVSFSEWSGSG